MTNRIKTVFQSLDRPAFIPFITAGDPDATMSARLLQSLAESGADVIEIGMPFTDPVADGESIQKANIRALDGGMNVHKTLDIVKDFRKDNDKTPLVLMGYANPIEQYDVQTFMKDAAEAGVDGVIIVDVPPEESADYVTYAEQYGISFIRLITPTTDEARLRTILDGASGFLYYVSITGVTGAAKPDPAVIENHMTHIRSQTDLPIAVGFGIKTPEDAAAFKGIADGVVVGSALVNTIEQTQNTEQLPSVLSKQARAFADALQS